MLSLIGCASVDDPARQRDPFETFNRAIYTFNDTTDRYMLRPIAKGYQKVVPKPVRNRITDFFSNLDDVVVLANDLLQLKFKQGASDFMRILFNTTFGLFGLFDVASHLDLPKHNEDFGQTLGFWGVPPGPYLVLPFLGPSTLRDSAGLVGDIYAYPLYWDDVVDTETEWAATGLRFIDARARLLGASRVVDEAALDPYTFVRDAYLQRRRNLVYDGNPPPNPEDDFLSDDNADANLDLELELELERERQGRQQAPSP